MSDAGNTHPAASCGRPTACSMLWTHVINGLSDEALIEEAGNWCGYTWLWQGRGSRWPCHPHTSSTQLQINDLHISTLLNDWQHTSTNLAFLQMLISMSCLSPYTFMLDVEKAIDSWHHLDLSPNFLNIACLWKFSHYAMFNMHPWVHSCGIPLRCKENRHVQFQGPKKALLARTVGIVALITPYNTQQVA